MQQSRFELKYLINESTAERVRDFVRCYLSLDEFSAGRPNYSYPVHSLSKNPDGLIAVQKFCSFMTELHARPKSHIHYKREAYVSDDDEVRVTLDRDVYSEAHLSPNLTLKMSHPVHSFKGQVILELKFTNRFPNWFRELVRMANVMQTGAPKYVSGITQIGRRRLNVHAEVLEEESLLSTFRPGDDLPAFVRENKGLGAPPQA